MRTILDNLRIIPIIRWDCDAIKGNTNSIMVKKSSTLLAVLALSAASCGSQTTTTSDAGDGGESSGTTVVATTSIWADVVRNVACTGDVDVVSVIPRGADPHSFEISLADRAILDDASLIVENGLFLEEGLIDTLETVEADGVPIFTASAHVDTIAFAESESHDDHEDDEHEDDEHEDHEDEDHDEHEGEEYDEHAHDGDDPHLWFDPINVVGLLDHLGEDLVAHAGLDADDVATCVEDFTAELEAADADAAESLAAIPDGQRVLVTNHDSLGYFAAHYDFEVLGTVLPGATTLAETNPAELDELRQLIDEAGVSAIFAETQSSGADIEALAASLDGVEIATLLTGTLGAEDSDSATYTDWLRTNAITVADALS